MATLPDAINQQFDEAVAAIATYETVYFAENGRFRQLKTLSDGGLTDPADVTIRVDVYDGPNGRGYVVVGQTEVDAVSYVRSTNVGPESYRTHDWAAKPEEIV